MNSIPSPLTREQVAKHLNVSVATIAALTRSGKLPMFKINNRVIRYTREAVNAFIEERNAVTGTAHPLIPPPNALEQSDWEVDEYLLLQEAKAQQSASRKAKRPLV